MAESTQESKSPTVGKARGESVALPQQARASKTEAAAPVREAERFTANALDSIDKTKNIREFDEVSSLIKHQFQENYGQYLGLGAGNTSNRFNVLSDILARRMEARYRFFLKIMEKSLRNLVEVFYSIDHPDGDREVTLRKFVKEIGFGHLLEAKDSAISSPNGGALVDTFSSATLKLTEAPELFNNRTSKAEKAPDFIKRVYGQWLTGEFTRADLRRLDRSAMVGLTNWERVNGRSDLNLPTLKERNDRKTEHFEVTPEVREYRRLQSARQRRTRNL